MGEHKTRLVGWHPSDPAAVAWLDAEIQRRGGGRGAQSAILDEALTAYRETVTLTTAGRRYCPRPRHKGRDTRLPLDRITEPGGGWACPGIAPDGSDCGYETRDPATRSTP